MASAQSRRAWGEVDDGLVNSALQELDRRLRGKFGDRYTKLILFGSRARGDHKPDSDADVAVVFRDSGDTSWSITQSVLAETYEILLDTGLFIEPRVVALSGLGTPDAAGNPELIREILRDGYTP